MSMREKLVKNSVRSGVWVLVALAVLVNISVTKSAAPYYPRVLAAAVPTAIASLAPFNNEGISSDSNPAANFDGGGRSYSNDALAAAGFSAGSTVTVGSYTFQWSTPAAGSADNWETSEQSIP